MLETMNSSILFSLATSSARSPSWPEHRFRDLTPAQSKHIERDDFFAKQTT